jgi:glycosyltransferase involved in cell wall biosynthesis
MRLLISTDAWRPQVNGVVRSLEYMAAESHHFGVEVIFLAPEQFRSFPLPTYNEIRLSLVSASMVIRDFEKAEPAHVHIATEGPIGIATRRACLRQGRVFTTSYHTRFPEYLSARAPIPEGWIYAFLRRFHNASCATMVSTASLERDLQRRGFRHIKRWTRGVDTDLFRPRTQKVLDLPEPIFLFVGRLAVEKNLDAFLSLDLPGSKVVVGDGPARSQLESRFPQPHFLGPLSGESLAETYASADVFVFPSLTDTFGIVLLEALASGLPIAAFPVTGPADVVGSSGCGFLSGDLREAALGALAIPKDRCRAFAETFTWRESARQFFANIEAAHEVFGSNTLQCRFVEG